MRKLVVGDIHGRYKALKQVLKMSKFDYKKDKLIILGDIVDGGYNTSKVVNELLKIKNKVFVLGNHDRWFMDYIFSGWVEEVWLQQGGAATLQSYGGKVKLADYITDKSEVNNRGLKILDSHKDFFSSAVFYHEEDNYLFVHGGYDPKVGVQRTRKETLLWDRTLIQRCKNGLIINDYDKVFVGHSTTQHEDSDKPVRYGKLIMMDCGAGWNGRLALMDIETEDVWLSEKQVPDLGV